MGDSDVLIILEDYPLKFDERIPAWMPSGIGVGVDVFPYTLGEAIQGLEEGWGVTRIALQEGVFLFSRDEKLAELFRGQRRVWGGTRSQGHHISA